MRMNVWQGFAAALLATAIATGAQGAVITQWNFNGASATTVPGGENSPTPSTGTGTASLVGGVTAAASFGSGTANGGSSDPVTTTPANYGWQTTNYPAASVGDKTAGTQFLVSTAGYEDITINYDLRHSNTSSRYEQLQYTVDGTTWIDLLTSDGNAGDTWFNARLGDLTGVAAADNNAAFGVRVVSTFGPGSGAYVASSSTGTYATGGTWRFDMVTISGTAVPEPSAVIIGGLGLIGLVGLARRSRRNG